MSERTLTLDIEDNIAKITMKKKIRRVLIFEEVVIF